MRDGDKIVSMIPAAGYLGESNDGDEATYNVGCDRGRAGSAPSRRNRSQWRTWSSALPLGQGLHAQPHGGALIVGGRRPHRGFGGASVRAQVSARAGQPGTPVPRRPGGRG